MEDIVIKRLDDVLDMLDCCKCEQCRLDIASYALNRLPSKYVVTTQGELLSKIDSLDRQFDAGVTAAVVNGAKIVKDQPRHNLKV